MTVIKKEFTKKVMLKNGNTRLKKVNRYRFAVTYKTADGESKRKFSKWFDSKEECERAEFEFKNIENHTTAVPIGLVGHKCIEDKKSRIAGKTYKEQMYIFDTWFASLHSIPVDEVKPYQIKQCFEPYLHLSTSRLNKGFDIMHNLFEYAITYYGLASNPMDRLQRFKKSDAERLKRMNIWTIDQFNTFYEAIPDSQLKYKALFHLLFFTGLRRNEALSLTWKEFDGKSVNVWRQWQDDKWSVLKTRNSARTVSLDSITIGLLYQLKAEQMEDEYFSENWFIFYGPKQISTSPIDKFKNKLIEELGLPYIRIHDLRHSHASYLISKGVNMYTVSRRLGHSSIQMTIDRYTHLVPNEADPVVDVLNECTNRATNFDESLPIADVYLS